MSHLSERAEAVQTWLEGDWCKAYVREGGCGWQSTSLVRKLEARQVCATELDGWEALAELAAAGVIEMAAPASAHQRFDVCVTLSEALRHRLESEFARVDDALELDAGQAAVWRHMLDGVLHGWSRDDQQRLAEGLHALARALPGAYAMSAFEASARYLLGSSKLLLNLPRELAHAFDIDPSAFRGPVDWVLAAVPPDPEGLLLIENPQSFDQACRLGLGERLVLVCSFGYGLSLGEALKAPERVRLIGEGAASRTLDELLGLADKTFWGDLDPQGLRLFLRLHQVVPGLRLAALYGPMIEAFEENGGHPLNAWTDKVEQRQVGTGATGRWSRGLDQAVLKDADLIPLAGQALDEATQQRWLSYLGEPDKTVGDDMLRTKDSEA